MKDGVNRLADRIVLVFVDGLGLRRDPGGESDPMQRGVCPCLSRMLAAAKPIDACLGVDGIPQSATGQTTLLTGVNAARIAGRHVEGFPGPQLREVIESQNIFRQLCGMGLSSTFANAYYVDDIVEVKQHRLQSVTTVAALSGLGSVRCRDEMLKNRAVYQDITRAALRARGYEGELITPPGAAQHLAEIASGHALTLFEYFQTDRAGHSRRLSEISRVLGELDGFLQELAGLCKRDGTNLILTSDHGNIEDVSTPLHTANAVPFFAAGPRAGELLLAVDSLTDVTPAIVACLKEAGSGGG